MKTDQKKRLVLIGIRRKGDSEFRLKTVKRESDPLKSEFPVHRCAQTESMGLYI
ncbi:MAG: hypothetical protein HOE30_04290 [Deltaproteobacteria bacterium]|jgi:hypothetical protein|nr:hypothetical protein [Deltaproteobacteria bacterium]MBT4087694.1 hypothetical protein [Deltaproteobacteria bacterium]MBT4267194.1 hypothetical protein [Deltaproteobacteria bacterium]MBT4638043.1 hypothetical protein [Deltaproteobacteria bacterium]